MHLLYSRGSSPVDVTMSRIGWMVSSCSMSASKLSLHERRRTGESIASVAAGAADVAEMIFLQRFFILQEGNSMALE